MPAGSLRVFSPSMSCSSMRLAARRSRAISGGNSSTSLSHRARAPAHRPAAVRSHRCTASRAAANSSRNTSGNSACCTSRPVIVASPSAASSTSSRPRRICTAPGDSSDCGTAARYPSTISAASTTRKPLACRHAPPDQVAPFQKWPRSRTPQAPPLGHQKRAAPPRTPTAGGQASTGSRTPPHMPWRFDQGEHVPELITAEAHEHRRSTRPE